MVKAKKYLPLFLIISIITIALDQLTKYLINTIRPQFQLAFLKIHLLTNTGAGFGILQGKTTFLAIISLVVTFIIILYYPKIPQKQLPQILLALLLGGVIGNAIDRIIRSAVIDFIDFSFWPAFNLADSAITIATIGLIIYFWKN